MPWESVFVSQQGNNTPLVITPQITFSYNTMETDKYIEMLETIKGNFENYSKMFDSTIGMLLSAAKTQQESIKATVFVDENISEAEASLLKYIPDLKKCRLVGSMLSHCYNNEDLKQALLSIEEEALIEWHAMDRTAFREIILSTVSYRTTIPALKSLMFSIKPDVYKDKKS